MDRSIIRICQRFARLMPWYWCCWWAIALWTDATGAAKVLGQLDAKWAFAGNYQFLQRSLQIYPIPNWLPAVLFALIILVLAVIVAIFAYASKLSWCQSSHWVAWTVRGFVVSLSLWLAFFIADQLILNFTLEQNHMVQGSFELLCFLFFLHVYNPHFGSSHP